MQPINLSVSPNMSDAKLHEAAERAAIRRNAERSDGIARNSEGMTFQEWKSAAAPSDSYMTEKALLTAWRRAEDPADYREHYADVAQEENEGNAREFYSGPKTDSLTVADAIGESRADLKKTASALGVNG